MSWFFRANFDFNLWFVALLCLNCMVFSSLGFLMALRIKSHPDMARFNNFMITPMILVCGTFFSVDRVPYPFSQIISLLPLTPANQGLRAAALGSELPWTAPTVQLVYLAVFLVLGLKACFEVE